MDSALAQRVARRALVHSERMAPAGRENCRVGDSTLRLCLGARREERVEHVWRIWHPKCSIGLHPVPYMEKPHEKAVVFLPWATIEPEAQQQILNTAKMPFVFKHVAVMPDCHYGKGATVGTVLPTQRRDYPGGCGG